MKRNTRLQITTSRRRRSRRLAVPVAVVSIAAMLMVSQTANAGIVPTVPLATAANFSVLGGQTVTNTGPSVLGQSLGVDPGPAVVGFGGPPNGTVLGSTEVANAVSLQAQSDLTIAYNDADGRVPEFFTNSDLVGLTLIPGIYAATAMGPLSLSGHLVLDGQGNSAAVFIFETDSTLITGSGSSIELINGASECNVFWQVGSSATLATGSLFVGTVMALTSISVQTGAVVHGRALARNGSVTLDNNVFTAPSCIPSTATAASTTTTAAPVTTVAPVTTIPVSPNVTLPRTGNDVGATPLIGGLALVVGAAALVLARRRRPAS
jgi:LPXTG-motif cell wall-anchored protein